MFQYSIRVTLDDDQKLLEFFKDYDCLITKEGADTEVPSEHYHMILKTELKIPALRVRIRNYFGFKGNKDYSIKQPKDEEELDKALRYICKGTKARLPTVIKNIGYDTDELHRRWWETNANVKRDKGKPKEECYKFLIDYFNNHIRGCVTEEEICDSMLGWYRENDYSIPHRTVGQSLIKQVVYELGKARVNNAKVIIYQYYGV